MESGVEMTGRETPAGAEKEFTLLRNFHRENRFGPLFPSPLLVDNFSDSLLIYFFLSFLLRITFFFPGEEEGGVEELNA